MVEEKEREGGGSGCSESVTEEVSSELLVWDNNSLRTLGTLVIISFSNYLIGQPTTDFGID